MNFPIQCMTSFLVLWKKIRPSLSAGRVQSVAVRLVVDREREIQAFTYRSIEYAMDGIRKLLFV